GATIRSNISTSSSATFPPLSSGSTVAASIEDLHHKAGGSDVDKPKNTGLCRLGPQWRTERQDSRRGHEGAGAAGRRCHAHLPCRLSSSLHEAGRGAREGRAGKRSEAGGIGRHP